jgi:hypothetical protein
MFHLFNRREERIYKLQEIKLIHMARRSAAWRDLQKRLSDLCDQFQSFGDDLPPSQTPIGSLLHLDDARDVMQLAESIARAVACESCKNELSPDLRLRLGTFHDWTDDNEAKYLCVLVSNEQARDH